MRSKNSKFGLIFTIVCNAAIVLCFAIGFFLLFFKIDLPDKLDKNTFINYMEAKGCKINDVLAEEDYSGIDDYLMTDKESCPYLVSYATFNDKKVLGQFFTQGRNDVLQNNPNTKGRTSVSVNVFSLQYYEYTTFGDYYKAIVYNDNSVLYASADREYREEVINVFKDFNYKYEINFKGMQIVCYSFFILLFICIVSMWGTLKKTRNKGWISLIPFYNIGCLSKDVLGSAWWPLLLFVPIGNVVFMFMFYYNLGKVFNKNDSYCVLTMFFPSVCWPLLAFDDSKYTKPDKKKKQIINQPAEKENYDNIKKVEIKGEKQISTGRKILNIIKWIFTVIFFLWGAFSILTYTEEKLIGYVLTGILSIIYGILICPPITDSTKKYKNYTKFKPLIVIILIVIHIIIFGILPF